MWLSLTEAAQLFDDGGQRGVGDTLQFAGHAIGQSASTQVPRLDVPLHQRHPDSGLDTQHKRTFVWLHIQVNKHNIATCR